MKCEHEAFFVNTNIARMPAVEGGPIVRFQANVTIVCDQCQTPFRFIGLPAGVDLNGAAVSIDGCEARLAIAPKGEVITPLHSTEVQGFTVRRMQ